MKKTQIVFPTEVKDEFLPVLKDEANDLLLELQKEGHKEAAYDRDTLLLVLKKYSELRDKIISEEIVLSESEVLPIVWKYGAFFAECLIKKYGGKYYYEQYVRPEIGMWSVCICESEYFKPLMDVFLTMERVLRGRITIDTILHGYDKGGELAKDQESMHYD